MARRAERHEGESRYPLRFATAAAILIAGTLVLVLYVLPERYVLRQGFRESGVTFPSPSTPFAPYPAVAVAAQPLPRPPGPPAPIMPGPAEAFWTELLPLFETGQYDDALPVFDRYLGEHPTDAGARRELALALLAAGRPVDAVGELRRLLADDDDFEQTLVLARTLRELGRTDEAAAEYERLSQARPNDVALVLEWAQAYAWVERYDDAASVLDRGLSRLPTSGPLRVELARACYASGRLEDARALLLPMGDDQLLAANALALRDAIDAALYVPPPPPLTPLEQAVAAREADDFARARALLEDALRSAPNDDALWRAYADLLEYELTELGGAHTALLEVERLLGADLDLELRLARLEIGLERTAEAERRLTDLLVALDADPSASTSTRAEVLATLGDLRRWQDDRTGAADRYTLALRADPASERARAGLDAVESDVARQLVEVEGPRLGGSAYSLADTDDFARVDLGGEWVNLGGPWVMGGTAGNRWISGVALDGSAADRRGAFVDLEGARWWRLGTIRTAIDFSVQRVRSVSDVSAGASVALRGADGSTSEVRYEHGPAYPIAVTMQSVLAEVVQDHMTASHARPLGERWTAATTVDGAWLRANADSVAGGSARGTGRLQGGLSVGRTVSHTVTLGLATRALAFTRSAPVTSLPGGGTLRLFWDPRLVVTVGPYAQVARDLSGSWKVTGRVTPGAALIHERGAPDATWVPHVSAEAGLRREGARFGTALDLFYYQGQFDGYRTYGARLTFSARDYSSLIRP